MSIMNLTSLRGTGCLGIVTKNVQTRRLSVLVGYGRLVLSGNGQENL